MYVLDNHFNGKPTILIDDYIINGCQRFKIEDAEPILKEFNVPADVWQQVLDVYTGVSTPEQIKAYLHHTDPFVRVVIADQGYYLDILVKDKHPDVREAVANKGYGLDILIKDPDTYVKTVAKYMLAKQ